MHNFKCFESQTVSIGSLTLLAGLNGMGKSTVLQAVLLLRQSYLDGLLPNTGLELNGSLVQMGSAKDVLYEGAQVDEFALALAWADGVNAKFVLQYQREFDVLKIDPTSYDNAIFTRIPFTDQVHYLRAERLGPRITNAVSDYQVREHRQLGISGEYAEHFLYVYGAQVLKDERLIYPQSKTKDLLNQVQAWLHEISPGTELHLSMHPEMDIVNLRYSFVAAEDRTNPYRSTSVGFGITYVLPLLVAILSSEPGTLLLVENPEAHLHPHGQVRIGELLARAAAAGLQVIVETHSDHILNGIRIAVHDGIINHDAIALHFFSRLADSGRIRSKVDSPVLDKDGRIDVWPEGFFDEWDKSLEQLLSPARQ